MFRGTRLVAGITIVALEAVLQLYAQTVPPAGRAPIAPNIPVPGSYGESDTPLWWVLLVIFGVYAALVAVGNVLGWMADRSRDIKYKIRWWWRFRR